MAQASTKMTNMLTGFLIHEIGAKSLDGITYAMVLKDEKSKEDYNHYMEIRDEVTKCGYGNDEVFRVYEVANGVIFDLDLNTAKRITSGLAVAVQRTNGINVGNGDLIGNSPEKRRKSDMLGLARYVQQEFNKGNDTVEVALFSRNSVPTIRVTGKSSTGEVLTVAYNAYAIRHWDIEIINSKLLIPAGIRIARLEPFEVLPSKTGVKFMLYLEAC